MAKKHTKRESAGADQRWETDGGTLDAHPGEREARDESDRVDAPDERTTAEGHRARRWKDETDQHWHGRGYSDETKRRAEGG